MAQVTREASQFVEQASRQLSVSMGYAQQLNTVMARISKSPEEIGKIIGTIENIAFQTNILVLNAAVEAAGASTIAQFTEGIEQISAVVQTNSATSEESAAASEELSSQSQLMKNMVGRFRLKERPSYGT